MGAQELPFCPFVEPGKGCNTRVPASCRHTPGCHKPQAGFLHFLPHEEESGEDYTSNPDPAPAITGQAVTSPGPGPCVPPLLLRTIRLGYAIQFARCPPKFRGIRFTSIKAIDAPVLRAEVAVLLAKDAIEPVPPADMSSGFYSPYFIVPNKSGGLRLILDLRVLIRALYKLPFKTLTQKHIFERVRPLDWFAAIDLKDACFYDSILPRHRAFLQFTFEGRACQYKLLPFGHLSQLGFQVNWGKSKLVPMQRISFLGMELDSVSQTARLTQEPAQSVLNCLKTLSGRTALPLKLFQRLLGHMAAAAAIVPLGPLHMRPLQHWLHGRIPRWAWKHGTHRVQITPACRKTFSPWSDPSFLRAGVPLEQVCRHAVVFTDASATGWGATYNGHAVSGVWTGPQLRWHINCLELLAVRLALSLRGCLQGKDVLVRTDGQYYDRCVYQPARRFTLPSHVATRPPPPPLESEASTFQECSIRRPTSCLERHFLGSGDSIPRRSS